MSKTTPSDFDAMKARLIANGVEQYVGQTTEYRCPECGGVFRAAHYCVGKVSKPTSILERIHENHSDNAGMGSSKPKLNSPPTLVKSPPRKVHGMGASQPSHAVRITLSRLRMLDRDNKWACVKSLVDGLVEAGLIPGDSESEIDLIVKQEKVDTRKEIKTVIEIES